MWRDDDGRGGLAGRRNTHTVYAVWLVIVVISAAAGAHTFAILTDTESVGTDGDSNIIQIGNWAVDADQSQAAGNDDGGSTNPVVGNDDGIGNNSDDGATTQEEAQSDENGATTSGDDDTAEADDSSFGNAAGDDDSSFGNT